MALARFEDLNLQLAKLMSNKEDGPLIDLLQAIGDDADTFVMNKDILRKTKIGHTVTKLKKATQSTEVRDLCDATIKRWKKQVGVTKAPTKKKPKPSARKFDDSSANEGSDNGSVSNGHTKRRVAGAEEPADESGDDTAGAATTDALVDGRRRPISPEVTGISMRDKMVKKIMSALDPAKEDKPEYQHYGRVAIEIEEELNGLFPFRDSSSRQDYLKRGSDLFFNLKNKENPELNLRLLTSQLAPREVVRMDNAQLASDSMKAKRQAKLTWEIEESRSDNQQQQAMTDEYKCGRCKSRKCKYYQQQTRGADEPMTTFITCTNCGNRWKN